MKWHDMLRFALRSLSSSLLRSLLTVLGFAVGVGAVLTVLTLGDAGEIRVETEIAKLGVNKVWVRQDDEAAMFSISDAQRLTAVTGAPACASAYTFTSVICNGRSATVQLIGLDERMQEVHRFKLATGRALRKEECRQGSLVCLIDETLADAFDVTEPGQALYAGNRRFVVVGVIETMAGQNVAGSSGMMIIPLQAWLDTFDGSITEILLHVDGGQNAEEVASAALAQLPDGSFRTDTLEEEIGAAREVIRIFVTVLMAVACVCMLSGGIGVMNVLVLAVRERRQEIGMLKAIGGTSGQICLLFLSEAMMYALLGGGLGVALGHLMVQCCGMLIGISGRISVLHILGVMVSAAAMGFSFGVIPAAMAAKLAPVEALRSE